MRKIFGALAMILFVVSCATKGGGDSTSVKVAQSLDQAMEEQWKIVNDFVVKGEVDSVNKYSKIAHSYLIKNYPLQYDWWLQDGDKEWFGKPIKESVLSRIDKVIFDLKDTDKEIASTMENKELLAIYHELCNERRIRRLSDFISKERKIVFTKFTPLRPSFFAYTEGASDARHECNFFPGGELSMVTIDKKGNVTEEVLLSDSVGSIRDVDVHYDAKEILFAWKKSAKDDNYHLYEMNMKDKKIKQLTEGEFVDFEGRYLPDENIIFNSTRTGKSVDCWFVEVSNLFLCNREGKYIRQIGFDQVHTPYPTVTEDGRVLYTRWDYNDRGQVFTQPLFQMNMDGTGQGEYYGMSSWFPTTIVHARQIPGTTKVIATFTGHHAPQHGKLGVLDIEAGRDENQGAKLVAPVRETKADRIDSYGQYSDQFQYPYPLNETDFLVSYSALGYNIGTPFFYIYWMNMDGTRELIVADDMLSCNQPILLEPRKRPAVRPSTVDYRKDNGVYYMQNIYEGMSMDSVKKGDVKKLRIVEIEFRAAGVGFQNNTGEGGNSHVSSPAGVGRASWDVKKVHGVVDVYPDGSAFFEVPARVPLYFQALDENNQVIQTMRSWSTLQPGEMQSCVGCHEHKNSVPLSDHPVSVAMNRGVQKIERVAHIPTEGFSYIKNVQPILDKHCISCHDGKNSFSLKGTLTTHETGSKRKFSDSYIYLTHSKRVGSPGETYMGTNDHPEVNWIGNMSAPTLLKPYSAGSATSNLIKRLRNGHGGTKLSKEEIEIVSCWIDLCVPFVGDYREANNWNEDEMKYYDYYDNKRQRAAKIEKEQIREYIKDTYSNL